MYVIFLQSTLEETVKISNVKITRVVTSDCLRYFYFLASYDHFQTCVLHDRLKIKVSRKPYV